MKFDPFTVQEGLPSSYVLDMKQDSQGYIWLAMQDGLVRYDGYDMKVYRPAMNKTSINYFIARSLIIDKNKSLWVALDGIGISRYNRLTNDFTQYAYPQEGPNKQVFVSHFEAADSEGNLWLIGHNISERKTGRSVLRFNTVSSRFETFDSYRQGTHYLDLGDEKTLYAGSGNRIWLGTDKGLYLFNRAKKLFSPVPVTTDTARPILINKIYEAPAEPGILWLSGQDAASGQYRIIRFDIKNEAFSNYADGASLPLLQKGGVVHMHEDKQHRLWFATSAGLIRFDHQTGSFDSYQPVDSVNRTDNRIEKIVEDQAGLLWLENKSLFLSFDPGKHQFQRYASNPEYLSGLSGDAASIFIDSTGLLWTHHAIGVIGKRNKLSGSFYIKTRNGDDTTGYPAGYTDKIMYAGDGAVFIVNKLGIYKWKPGSDQIKLVIKNTDPKNRSGEWVMVGRDSNFYFINRMHVEVYNTRTYKLSAYPLGFERTDKRPDYIYSAEQVTAIKQDHTGLIWIGTNDNGICAFNPAHHTYTWYTSFSNREGFNLQVEKRTIWVRDILEDKNGTIWIGTGGVDEKEGLFRVDRNTGKVVSPLKGSTSAVGDVLCLFEDKSGRLWVGTTHNGVYEFDRTSGRYVRHFDETNGLLFNHVRGISEDGSGSLWIASSRGLSCLQPASGKIKNYGLNDILPGSHNPIFRNALLYTNGLMILGLEDGIAWFDPKDLVPDPHLPIVHIEQIGSSNPRSASDSVTNRFTFGLQQLELPWNQNRISFRYVALHYVNPSQNKYAYFLEEYDKQWVQAGTQRSVTYTNLPPGTYTFRVRACNSDGVWNNRGDSFTFTILSPWWQRWWAWALYVAVAAGAVYAFTAFRARQLIKEKQLLEEGISQRTAQLSRANRELSEHQEQIIRQRDQLTQTVTELKATQQQLIQSEKLASLGELTAGIAHEIQNPLNFVNNFSEVSKELVDEMQAELKVGHPEEAEAIAGDIKQNLEKIHHHGKRADAIVKNMLQHSRNNSGERRPTDINALADEYLRLSYHGLRTKDKSFNAAMTTHFAQDLPKANVVPQDIGRVLLNLFSNAFYAVNKKRQTANADYKPEVTVSTAFRNGQVSIGVKDNGTGIPDAIKDKVLQPFFTTKPTGEGTGLGLSLSYDTVVKGHGGTLKIDSQEGAYTEFVITLPL
ncbi:MAG: hypothetical protein INR73_01480 [Williamsia sp.]|nr:hypothetical protein [Williamsia sp.]